MNCKAFHDRIFLLQAGELPEAERLDCQSHLDACEACLDRLRFEDAALGALKAKLARASAPPGLETRIRAALRTDPARSGRVRWYRAGWFAAAAVAAVLVLLLLRPSFRSAELLTPGTAGGATSGTVTVVDLDCDRAGRSLEQQRRCTQRLHLNALKLADGTYWTIDTDPAEFRYLMLDPRERGQTLRVVGRLLGGTNVIRLESVDRLDARRLSPARYPRVLPAAASGVP